MSRQFDELWKADQAADSAVAKERFRKIAVETSRIMEEEQAKLQPMRSFETGATRGADDGKLDYEGFLSPWAMDAFARYMDRNRITALGVRDSDNWQKGIPASSYIKSLIRHAFEAWRLWRAGQEHTAFFEDAVCAIIFNAQGLLHIRLAPPNARVGSDQAAPAPRNGDTHTHTAVSGNGSKTRAPAWDRYPG